MSANGIGAAAGHDDTDYLVVGAGATGMAFVDTLLTRTDASVVIVDRRDAPGGHWLDAYPFVRLHQPSATYGVESRALGENRIDSTGPNAGCYERATGDEIRAYFARVMSDFIASGRVRFLGMHDFLGRDGDGHRVRSRLTGRVQTLRARRLVDATYTEAQVPRRHTRAYLADDTTRLIPPNELPETLEPSDRVTVIGAGKTAMDTCAWLLDHDVDPDRIRWVKPRDPWLFNREYLQPLELVSSSLQMQARWLEAAAGAVDGQVFTRHLADNDVLLRIDPTVQPQTFRLATLSRDEVATLSAIENVVRSGRVRRIAVGRLLLDGGEVMTSPGEVYVDCTAKGIPHRPARPIFEGDRITCQYVTTGIASWSAATIAAVESSDLDTDGKNALCPPVSYSGDVVDVLDFARVGLVGSLARASVPELAAWNESCRLNPLHGVGQRGSDSDIAAGFRAIMTWIGPALDNLSKRTARAACA
jgi:cation diffusion facilitator CzcD-associated flavoprotein CzcO